MSENAKHTPNSFTPGPWAIREMRTEDCELDRWIVDHAETKIAVCEQWSDKCAAESDANARLIASAPELLAERDRLREQNAELVKALQNVLQLAESLIPDGAVYTLEENGPTIDSARAVLAEARGK